MNHNIMLDLETLGTRPGCVVLTIGAVEFDPVKMEDNWLGPEFYKVVGVNSCVEKGLIMEPDTVAWWQGQEGDSVAELDKAVTTDYDITTALADFSSYLSQFENVHLWGCGAGFDQPILEACYHAVGCSTPPWKFYNNRCYRTLKALVPSIQAERVGVYHHALDDAKTQAVHACNILNRLTASEVLYESIRAPSVSQPDTPKGVQYLNPKNK